MDEKIHLQRIEAARKRLKISCILPLEGIADLSQNGAAVYRYLPFAGDRKAHADAILKLLHSMRCTGFVHGDPKVSHVRLDQYRRPWLIDYEFSMIDTNQSHKEFRQWMELFDYPYKSVG